MLYLSKAVSGDDESINVNLVASSNILRNEEGQVLDRTFTGEEEVVAKNAVYRVARDQNRFACRKSYCTRC